MSAWDSRPGSCFFTLPSRYLDGLVTSTRCHYCLLKLAHTTCDLAIYVPEAGA